MWIFKCFILKFHMYILGNITFIKLKRKYFINIFKLFSRSVTFIFTQTHQFFKVFKFVLSFLIFHHSLCSSLCLCFSLSLIHPQSCVCVYSLTRGVCSATFHSMERKWKKNAVLFWQSRLNIWHCQGSSLGHYFGTSLIFDPGTSTCLGCCHMKYIFSCNQSKF